ncbi:MAG: glycoside hydrolase family 5 protein [Acutalibacteraceae bacterium]
MKLFKKTLALFLSTVLLAGLLAVPAMQASAADETETRIINLLDLSGYDNGTVLSKDNLENWPEGMTVGAYDDYDGTRSVVELEDGSKALKLAFDQEQDMTQTPSSRQLDAIANYEFRFQIPAAYRPYLNSVKLTMENRSNVFTSWENELEKPYFLLAFSDGTNYSKIADKTLWIESIDYEYTLSAVGVAKVDAWGYTDWADINSAAQWTEADKAGMTEVVLSVTVPFISDTTTYMLIKGLELEVVGTADQLDSAEGKTTARTINLLDLSGYDAGTVLSKDNLENWPEGMTVGAYDDYDGTRSVVELEDGSKALKLAFDQEQDMTQTPSSRQLDAIANYEFRFQIPAAYRPYLNSVKLTMENRSNVFTSWENELEKPYFLLAFSDGTNYSKIADKTLWIESIDYEYTLSAVGVAKVDAWGYTDWADINSAAQWTEADKAGMTEVVLSVTVPFISDTTTYMLIKGIELEVVGTADELDAAKEQANNNRIVTRKVNLLDLSKIDAGTVLSKDNLENWPNGMTVGNFDDYNGTRSVVELEDGTKALKLAFDQTLDLANIPSERSLYAVANYEFRFQIPAAYRPYLNSVKLTMDNMSNVFTSWENELEKPYFLLAFTDGTNYSKIADKTLWIDKVNYEYTLDVAGVAKIGEAGYVGYADLNSATKWTEDEKTGMTEVVLSVTVPYISDTTTYMLIKNVELEVTGTAAELDAAEKASVAASALINDFENDNNAFVAAEDGVFAASGSKVFRYHRDKEEQWEGYTTVSLDSNVRNYDGISFYLYNPNESKELKCFLRAGDVAVAQKNFTASKTDDYLKYTIWFDDVGTTTGAWDSYTSNTGKSLTAAEVASLTDIGIIIPEGGANVSYYFDDFCYEKRNSEPVKEKKFDLTTAVVTEDNGYTDTETPVITADGITYSVDGTRSDQSWQGWKTVIDVSDGSMINASGIKINAQYASTGNNKLRIGATLYGVDDNGNEQWWNWGENPDCIWPAVDACTAVIKSLNYNSGLYETGWWGIYNWGNTQGYPTGSENAMLKEIQLYVWAPADAEAGDTVTISDVSVVYGGGKVSLADGVTGGTISVGDNGYTYSGSSAVSNTGYFFAGEKAVINVIPDEGYALVPGSLKLTDSTGKEIETTREGFRKLNSIAYGFTMPVADITVSAEFAPEADVLGTVYSNVSADIANNQLKFDYTVPLKNGKVMVDGTEYEAVGYGVLVTTGEVLEKYSFWDGFAVEDIENGNYIAELSTNVHVNESEGYFYDKSVSVARFNAVVNIPDSMKDTDFAVRAYIEYENGNGDVERNYSDVEYGSFTYAAFGMYEFAAAPSYAKGVNMAGVFDNTSADATALRNSVYVASETYEAVAYEGFDHVRLPVTFASHLDADGSINADYLEAVDKAVIAALSNDLTVVIDLHHYSDLKTDFTANKANFYSIWEQLAEHYKNYPNRVIFELLNEPSTVTGAADAMTAASLNEIQLAAVEKIRAIDSDRMIALAVFDNNSALNLNDLVLPADTSNLIVSVHNYDHYAFTHQGIDGSDTRLDYTESGSKDLILDRLQRANEFSKANNIPVWISEFGVYLGGLTTDGVFTTDDVTAYYNDFTTACNNYGIGWCVWEYNVGFGVFNPDNTLKDFVKAGLFPNG